VIVAFIYVSLNCPICKSLLRYAVISRAASRKCVPLRVKAVELISPAERLEVWPPRLTPQGLMWDIRVPYLVIADSPDGVQLGTVLYRQLLEPQYPTGFTEPEARAIVLSTYAFCANVRGMRVPKGDSGGGGAIGESGESEGGGDVEALGGGGATGETASRGRKRRRRTTYFI
jgi:hypothetical protein